MGFIVISLRGGVVLYILPFGLVRLRTFGLVHGLVRCKHEHRCARARGEDVSFKDVKIEILDSNWNRVMWVTSRTGIVRWGFWGFEKNEGVQFLPRRKKVDFQSWARPDEFVRYGRRTWFGADGKVSIERLCLSLLMSKKPFNSKVIKSFVPELRSRKCFFFFVFRHSYVIYIWVINILCTFHIFMYGYVTWMI